MIRGAVTFTHEVAKEFGVKWIDPWQTPSTQDQGISGVCEWRPGQALARIGRTNATVGHVHALPYSGEVQCSIKERHTQDEMWVVFDELYTGLSKTMEPTADDVTWVLWEPGIYVIPAGCIHVPPVSRSDTFAAMLVVQGTTNETEPTFNIPYPRD